ISPWLSRPRTGNLAARRQVPGPGLAAAWHIAVQLDSPESVRAGGHTGQIRGSDGIGRGPNAGTRDGAGPSWAMVLSTTPSRSPETVKDPPSLTWRDAGFGESLHNQPEHPPLEVRLPGKPYRIDRPVRPIRG